MNINTYIDTLEGLRSLVYAVHFFDKDLKTEFNRFEIYSIDEELDNLVEIAPLLIGNTLLIAML